MARQGNSGTRIKSRIDMGLDVFIKSMQSLGVDTVRFELLIRYEINHFASPPVRLSFNDLGTSTDTILGATSICMGVVPQASPSIMAVASLWTTRAGRSFTPNKFLMRRHVLPTSEA